AEGPWGGLLVRRSGGPAEAGGRAGRGPPAEEGSIWARGWGRRRIRPGPVPRSSGGAAERRADRSKSPPMVPTRHRRGHGRDGAGRRGPRGKRSPTAAGPAGHGEVTIRGADRP